MSQEQNQQPNLTLNDFQNVVNLIDVVVQRGAIRGEELSTVGGLRTRFSSFIEASRNQPAPEQAVTNPEGEPQEVEEDDD